VLGVPFLTRRTARVALSSRSGPNEGRQAQTPSDNACTPPGSSWHRGDRNGCPSPPRSGATSASVRYSRVRNLALGRRCGVTVDFGARRHQLEMGICHDFPSPQQINCSNNSAAAINSRGLAHRKKQPRSWMRWYSCAATVLLFGLMQISVAVKSDSAHIISCDGSPLRNGISAHVSMGRWARHAGGGVADVK
jgi:hypothetical protein